MAPRKRLSGPLTAVAGDGLARIPAISADRIDRLKSGRLPDASKNQIWVIIRHRSAAWTREPSGATPAILLNARRTQTGEAMGLVSVFPGEELFLRQLVDLASLLDGDHTAAHCDDDRGLTTYYPSAGVRRWQTFAKQHLNQGITRRRFHGAARRR